MAFGISGVFFNEDGKQQEFGYPYSERKTRIAAMPNNSIKLIRIYQHGAPGYIGEDDANALAQMLKDKMQKHGQIQLLGCSTAGVEGHAWNPVGGIGLLTRMIMYHGVMKMMGLPEAAKKWSDNVAGDTSRLIPNVYVMGLSGISFPLSRIHDSLETGFKPSALMADRFVYMNGKLLSEYNNFNLPK
ncbi:hypothetical protein [Aliiruegeria lutimaris]|uniref:Uncharacterized protein n=1 Tax=Aliiruegeria lutimaris TaxID=571298 RepID=A0A1G8PMU4_9RHOB|nr:hypothetical protein [Aliiruegeria lutimaris]SDI93793.1 hypothetical protein SAMN04488026_100951 [Aliiruegeria lutimaris]